MDRPEIAWDHTPVFTTGTVGPRGRRVFFLQARHKDQVLSLKLEKQQVAGLADFLEGMLDDLPPVLTDQPTNTTGESRFEEPDEADWVIGNLGVTYQQDTDQVILFAEELVREETKEPARVRLPLSRFQVVEFVEKARQLVSEGRDPCPLCGAPLDPASDGWCPCVN